jgi:serine/threonine protein kinase
MGVKHRDLKPSNVLVHKDSVLLTDFGISTITAPDEDSASNGSIAAHTYVYSAPEIINDVGSRRGRAADIFSLGCVFLELSAALAGPPGAREMFNERKREVSGTMAYAENQQVVLQWIRYLWTYDYHAAYLRERGQSSSATIGFHTSELAFLMLEPDPTKRITTTQLLDMMNSPSQPYFHIRNSSCEECRKMNPECCELGESELHSTFKTDASRFSKSITEALMSIPAVNWEEAKRRWLHSHINWRDPTTQQLDALALELNALALSAE